MNPDGIPESEREPRDEIAAAPVGANASPQRVTLPWCVWSLALAAIVIQFIPGAREHLLYDRAPLAAGQFWRIWTGHLVHFGWPHFLVDVGLLLIVGWFVEPSHPVFARLGCLLMPAFISASIYWLEPTMIRYGGLSALNLGLLFYLAAQGWRRDWTDWFWPAVLLGYVAELLFEYYRGGHGGGTIRFDDPGIQVATGAHLASTAYALLALGLSRLNKRGRGGCPQPPSG